MSILNKGWWMVEIVVGHPSLAKGATFLLLNSNAEGLFTGILRTFVGFSERRKAAEIG